jgi:hypothetical protein
VLTGHTWEKKPNFTFLKIQFSVLVCFVFSNCCALDVLQFYLAKSPFLSALTGIKKALGFFKMCGISTGNFVHDSTCSRPMEGANCQQ